MDLREEHGFSTLFISSTYDVLNILLCKTVTCSNFYSGVSGNAAMVLGLSYWATWAI